MELSELADNAGQLVSFGGSLIMLAFGKAFWVPEVVGDRKIVIRLFGILSAVGIAFLYVQSQVVIDAPRFSFLSLILGVVGCIAGFLFIWERLGLCFRCDDDDNIYIKGLILNREAKKLLAGDREGLSKERADIGEETPNNPVQYFCDSSKDPKFIWTHRSHVAANLLLILTAGIMVVTICLALFSGAVAINQIKVTEKNEKITIELPSDVLFEFAKHSISPKNLSILNQIATEIHSKEVSRIIVEGHTDDKGSDQFNQDLSEKRAKAVAEWLIQSEAMNRKNITSVGYGEKRPLMPKVKPDDIDDPDRRAKNRRVNIILIMAQ